jgi:hypothetical protein
MQAILVRVSGRRDSVVRHFMQDVLFVSLAETESIQS